MPRTVTRAFLRSRYWAATAAILLSLAVSLSIVFVELQRLRGNSNHFMAFVQLIEAESQFEVEIVRARLESEQGALSAAQRQQLQATYRDLVSAFTALRYADEDSVETGEEEREEAEEEAWDEIARALAVDAEASAAALKLQQDQMPSELEEIWEAEEDSSEDSLEDMIGELIEEAYPIVQSEGRIAGALLESVQAIEALSVEAIRPAFEQATQAIRDSSGGSASFAFLVLLAAGIAVGLVALGSAVLVYEPMLRSILQSQDWVLAERDRAIASEQVKRRFLAVMSHEIRTPMNGVMGFANLLLGTRLTAQQQEFVETIQSSGASLLSLLNDILDFSRMEAGSLELELEDFAIDDVVADVITLLGAQATAKRLELSGYTDPSLPETLRGDPGRLRQILVNLVGNAIKFTDSGTVAIEVKQEGIPRAGERELLISVSDTGSGIPEDSVGSIFESFSQADTSATRSFEGSGLGLAICKELAGLMQGEIGVESTPGKGSTFWVRVRLKDVVPPAETLRHSLKADLTGKRLLVVDDNAVNRRIFKLQLEGFGAEVGLVADAKSALTQLTEAARAGRPYHLAVLDRMMPEVDGMELCKMIKAQPQFLGLPLILASSGIDAARDGEILGFDASFPKPVLQSTLVRTIHDLISGREAEQAAARLEAGDSAEPSAAEEPLAKARLLLVEDNSVNQRLVATRLTQAGYSVDIAADGVEAVQAAQRLPYDLILMDIRLPVMSGVEAAQRIKSLDNVNAQCPIFALTANAMKGDREEYLAAGMTEYITKPIDLDDLLAKIEAALQATAGDDRQAGTA